MEFEVDDTVQYYGVVKSTKRLATLIKAMHINAVSWKKNDKICLGYDQLFFIDDRKPTFILTLMVLL